MSFEYYSFVCLTAVDSLSLSHSISISLSRLVLVSLRSVLYWKSCCLFVVRWRFSHTDKQIVHTMRVQCNEHVQWRRREKKTRQQSSVHWRLTVQTGMIFANNSAAIQENKIVKKQTLRDVSYTKRVSVATDALAFSTMRVFACISQPHLNSAIKVRRILRLCDVFVVSFFHSLSVSLFLCHVLGSDIDETYTQHDVYY